MTVPVAVNLLWCLPGQVGGSEEYLTRILAGLADDGHGFAVSVFAPPGLAEAHPDVAGRLHWRVGPVHGSSRPRRVVAERTWLGQQVRRDAFRLVHHAGGTAPGGQVPAVLTVHDLQYLTYPAYFSRQKLRWLQVVVPRSVRRAAVVSVPSEYVRSTVVEAFGVPGERVVVVPHGFRAPCPGAAVPEPVVRARYDLPGPYFVYPAVTHPHKDHVTLLRAAACLLPRHPELRLVLTGAAGAADATVAAVIGELGLGERVVRPGRVPDADRDGLVAHATALAFPSRYEGFGAPVLEAMALGTPVVAAATTALPEVTNGAARLVPAGDVGAWAAALEQVLDDPSERERLRGLGRARAAELDIARSAAAQAHAYGLALA